MEDNPELKKLETQARGRQKSPIYPMFLTQKEKLISVVMDSVWDEDAIAEGSRNA